MARSKLRMALVQARDEGDPTREEEVASFANRAGLDASQLTPVSVVDGQPLPGVVEDFDGVFVGGAGDYFVSKGNLPFTEPFFDLLRGVVARRQPMFCSCFGFQCLSKALGGEVVFAPERTEVGTFDLHLTAEGLMDCLLGELPSPFAAQMGRKDIVEVLPDDAIHLAFSELCPHQALRIRNAPIWATQFHPELDHATNRKRFENYVESYQQAMTAEEIQQSLDSYRASPEAGSLLRRFVELVFD